MKEKRTMWESCWAEASIATWIIMSCSAVKRETFWGRCVLLFCCRCTSGANLVENRAFVYYGSLCLSVVAFRNTDLGNLWQGLPSLVVWIGLDLCLTSKRHSAVWFVILCWHIRHTHLPSSMQSGRTSYPHVATDLMGFTPSSLSQHSVPPGVRPPGCVHLLCHDIVSRNRFALRVWVACISIHSTSSGLLCSDLSSSLPPGCRRYSVALMKPWIQETWLSARVTVSSSSHLFDTFIKVCTKMLCPWQVLDVHLKFVCTLPCAFVCEQVCVSTCYLFVVLVCCHKLL